MPTGMDGRVHADGTYHQDHHSSNWHTYALPDGEDPMLAAQTRSPYGDRKHHSKTVKIQHISSTRISPLATVPRIPTTIGPLFKQRLAADPETRQPGYAIFDVPL